MKIHKATFSVLILCILAALPFTGTGAQTPFALSDLEPIRARINVQPDSRLLQFMETAPLKTEPMRESTPRLESWMLDTGDWVQDRARLGSAVPIPEPAEEEPVLEDWMTAPAISGDRLLSSYIKEDKEPDINLEPWMLDRKFWETSLQCCDYPLSPEQ